MNLIEKVAKEKNFTVSQLARDVGVSRPTVYGWYGGKEPTVSDILRIAEVLGVKPSEIFKDYIK